MHHPAHARPDSPPHPPTHPGVAATASRLLVSMRRSFTPAPAPRRKIAENPRAAMYSTPEERHAYPPSRYLDARPTIEQIAMGLHVSRTPHLRPVPGTLQRHPLPSLPPHRSPSTPATSLDNPRDVASTSSHSHTRHSLPPPPSRSSMKKTSPSVSTLTQPQHQAPSAGVSSLPSGGSIAQDPPRPLSSLRVRMSKFMTGYRPLSSPSSLGRASSFTSSASDSTRPATPRKAVRFSTSVLAVDERAS